MNRNLASFVFTGETLFRLPVEEAKPPAPKKIVGKSTLVLVDVLGDTDREFLEKVMASVGVAAPDMEILVRKQLPEYDLSALEKVTRIVAFGDFLEILHPAEKLTKYTPVLYSGQKILVADPLNTVSLNRANEKRNLWMALKEMFGLG